MAHDQHEIATETISLQQGLQDKGYEEWVGEMIGMREILKHFANVSANDVVGMRAPYLKPGRNAQYKVRTHKCILISSFTYVGNKIRLQTANNALRLNNIKIVERDNALFQSVYCFQSEPSN